MYVVLLSASVLVSRYRSPEGSTGKQEPIDAEESKLILLALAYVLVQVSGLPSGPTVLVLFLLYLPAAVGYVTWCWGYDEFVDGLGLFLIYVLLPGLPLLLAGWLAGLWRTLAQNAPWLLTPNV